MRYVSMTAAEITFNKQLNALRRARNVNDKEVLDKAFSKEVRDALNKEDARARALCAVKHPGDVPQGRERMAVSFVKSSWVFALRGGCSSYDYRYE